MGFIKSLHSSVNTVLDSVSPLRSVWLKAKCERLTELGLYSRWDGVSVILDWSREQEFLFLMEPETVQTPAPAAGEGTRSKCFPLLFREA